MPTSEHQEFAAFLDRETQVEAGRARIARQASLRSRGVAWSALGHPPYEPCPPEVLTARAREKFAARRAWRESDSGNFLTAVVESQAAARDAHSAGERAREAWSRGGEPRACAAAADELEHLARHLLLKAQATRRAALRLAAPPEARPAD